MNTMPTIKVTDDGPEVGVATARLLLQHALEKEDQAGDAGLSDVVRDSAINDLTGASIHLPPEVLPEKEHPITTHCSKEEETGGDDVMWEKRNLIDTHQSSLQ